MEGDHASSIPHDAVGITIDCCRKILQDVVPTLLPHDELGDLAAAEQAVNAKVAERTAVVDKLQDELRCKSSSPSSASSSTYIMYLFSAEYR